ncbi:MAG: RluA family pseudouridine synthase, partial [Lachnospiraceae bacterium]|nr:RluA family pseudouridine synthase [Lachnospiraceae bacterium]
MKLNILFEDEYMLVCVKPYGVPSQGDKSNDEDMVTILKNYLFDKADSDEEPYLAVIHRLDRPVGGVMIFAKTREAAGKLSDMMQEGKITKYYQAVLTGELPDFDGDLVDYMIRDAK